MLLETDLLTHNGTEYVAKRCYDELLYRFERYETVVVEIKRKACSLSEERPTRRPRSAPAAERPSSSGDEVDGSQASGWSVHKVSGTSFTGSGIAGATVQLYRIDTGVSSSRHDDAEASSATGAEGNTGPEDAYLYRPRDVLEMLAGHEEWQPDQQAKLAKKIGNLVNHKSVSTVQDPQRLQRAMKRVKADTGKVRDDIPGFRNVNTRVMTFGNMIELYVKVLSHARTLNKRAAQAAAGSGQAEGAEHSGEAAEQTTGSDEAAAAAAADDDATADSFLRADVTAAFLWMKEPGANVVAPSDWVAPKV